MTLLEILEGCLSSHDAEKVEEALRGRDYVGAQGAVLHVVLHAPEVGGIQTWGVFARREDALEQTTNIPPAAGTTWVEEVELR